MSPRRVLRYVETIRGRLALLGYLILTAGVLLALYGVSQQIEKNHTAVDALCLQRADLDQRIAADKRRLDRSRNFLRTHPKGIPGIPASLIKQGLDDDEITLQNELLTRRNLSILDC